MNKKIFGIRVGTIITVIVCFVLAVFMWLFVNFKNANAFSGIMLLDFIRGLK